MKNSLTVLLMLISTLCLANPFVGHWEGKFILNGSGWPMRLHIHAEQGKIQVQLDIPNLVFAGEPVSAVLNQDTIRISLPFGIGDLSFTHVEDQLIPMHPSQSTIFRRIDPLPYNVEELRWQNGQAILYGSLYRPRDIQRPPVLIRMHGSVDGTRAQWNYRSWADYFARKGIATVVFDRRGEGASTGQDAPDFDQLADDVIQLIELLKQRTDLDLDRLILNGGSQATYIALLANARCEEVDFLLLSGAPSVSIVEQERASLSFRMQKDGESPSAINAALGYQNLYFHYIMTGKNWAALTIAATEAQSASWAKYTDQPRQAADLNWWRNNYHVYQPAQLIPQIKIPTLLLFGEEDAITPPSVMIPYWEKYYNTSGNGVCKIVVCPSVGHNLEVPFHQDQWGNIVFPQRSPEMFSAIEEWLEQMVFDK